MAIEGKTIADVIRDRIAHDARRKDHYWKIMN